MATKMESEGKQIEHEMLRSYAFETIPTFRKQEDDVWNGRSLFEQYLVDLNVGWFVYVKLFVPKNGGESLPLVIGKTGSLLVNAGGTDVNFSTDPGDGPARLFLYEGGQMWDRTKILLLRGGSELEALEMENEITKRYGLFGS